MKCLVVLLNKERYVNILPKCSSFTHDKQNFCLWSFWLGSQMGVSNQKQWLGHLSIKPLLGLSKNRWSRNFLRYLNPSSQRVMVGNYSIPYYWLNYPIKNDKIDQVRHAIWLRLIKNWVQVEKNGWVQFDRQKWQT